MTDTMSRNSTTRRDELVYGGICPVCGDEFVDGFEPLEEFESYSGRICVVEKDEGIGSGTMLVHLDEAGDGTTATIHAGDSHDEQVEGRCGNCNERFHLSQEHIAYGGTLWCTEQCLEEYAGNVSVDDVEFRPEESEGVTDTNHEDDNE